MVVRCKKSKRGISNWFPHVCHTPPHVSPCPCQTPPHAVPASCLSPPHAVGILPDARTKSAAALLLGALCPLQSIMARHVPSQWLQYLYFTYTHAMHSKFRLTTHSQHYTLTLHTVTLHCGMVFSPVLPYHFRLCRTHSSESEEVRNWTKEASS